MISHHPSPELLADCTRGALDAGATLVVATHVHGCAVCRKEVGLLESVGGILLDQEAPAALSENALESALARIDQQGSPYSKAPKGGLPRYLERFAISGPLEQQKMGRRLWVTPNIWFASIDMGRMD